MWNFIPRQKCFFVLIAAKVHTRAEVRNPFICQRGFSVLFFLYSATLSYMWLVFLFACLFFLYWNNFITNNDWWQSSVRVCVPFPPKIPLSNSVCSQVCKQIWLGLYDDRTSSVPDFREPQKVKEFLQDKYEKKRWYVSIISLLRKDLCQCAKFFFFFLPLSLAWNVSHVPHSSLPLASHQIPLLRCTESRSLQ